MITTWLCRHYNELGYYILLYLELEYTTIERKLFIYLVSLHIVLWKNTYKNVYRYKILIKIVITYFLLFGIEYKTIN